MATESTTSGFSVFKINLNSIQGTVTFSFMITVLISTLTIIYFNYSSNYYHQNKISIIQQSYPIQLYSSQLLQQIKASEANLNRYFFFKDDSFQKANKHLWMVSIPSYKDSLANYIVKTENEGLNLIYIEVAKNLVELDRIQNELKNQFNLNSQPEILDSLYKIEWTKTSKILDDNLDKLLLEEEKRRLKRIEEQEEGKAWLDFFTILFISIGVLFVYFIGYNLMRREFLKIRDVRKNIETLALGDLPKPLPPSQNEFGGVSYYFNELLANIEKLKSFIDETGKGSFKTDILNFPPKSELGTSLLQMSENLGTIYDEERQQNWVTQGLNKFSSILQVRETSVQSLAQKVLNELVHHLDAIQGGFFVIRNDKDEDPYFELQASYAYGKEKFLKKQMSTNEGMLGRAYQEKDLIYLDNLPQHYTKISSALGDTEPNTLVVVPLKHKDNVEGVIELASMNEFSFYERDFLDKLSHDIGSALDSLFTNLKNEELLADTRELTETLKNRESELQQNTQELIKTREETERKLNSTTSELQYFNTIFSSVPQPILVHTSHGKIMQANEAFSFFLGYEVDELLGKNINRILSGTDKARYKETLQNRSSQDLGVNQFMMKTSDDDEIPVKIFQKETEANHQRFFVILIQPLSEPNFVISTKNN